MEITFLGTAGMQPTPERNLISIYIGHANEKILVDCGEGTQRQFKIAKLKPTRLTRIFISHLHGDHILGLGGLVRNLAANQYQGTLHLYGPKGLKDSYNHLTHAWVSKERIKVKIHEINQGKILDNDDLEVYALKLKHSPTCFGYRFKEKDKRKINLAYTSKLGLKQHPLLGKLQKGKDIIWKGKKITVEKGTKLIKGKILSIVLDTAPCENAIKLAKNSDLLISEATFSESDKPKADEVKHLTAKQAAEIAKKANTKKLILTHFSQRYKNVKELKQEAQKVFKNTQCSEDFLIIKV